METTNTISKLHTAIEVGMSDFTREQYLKAKERWKKLASDLKEIKATHKQTQREHSKASELYKKTKPRQQELQDDVDSKWRIEIEVFSAKGRAHWYFRCYHIAYCLARGTSYAKIEKDPKTEPNWTQIKKILVSFKGE